MKFSELPDDCQVVFRTHAEAAVCWRRGAHPFEALSVSEGEGERKFYDGGLATSRRFDADEIVVIVGRLTA